MGRRSLNWEKIRRTAAMLEERGTYRSIPLDLSDECRRDSAVVVSALRGGLSPKTRKVFSTMYEQVREGCPLSQAQRAWALRASWNARRAVRSQTAEVPVVLRAPLPLRPPARAPSSEEQ
jgi:hypothetical protein